MIQGDDAMNVPELAGKVAVVTGGGGGIGRAVALALAGQGTAVGVGDIDEAGGAETVRLIEAQAGRGLFVPLDVRDSGAVAQFMQTVQQTWGQLDIAINNAGIEGNHGQKMGEYDTAVFDQVMQINLYGVWHCMQAELPIMLAQGQGIIINVASIAGLLAMPRNAAYAASKHAVVGLTRSAALEYVRQGIRINAICPGFTDTAMVTRGFTQEPRMAEQLIRGIPARRLGLVEEVAGTVLYLCSPAAGFMVGQTVVLDGGIAAG
jgi:NAD(P)-dependent dehydrogenase (short-subunit alcohol dehydrogenase family)